MRDDAYRSRATEELTPDRLRSALVDLFDVATPHLPQQFDPDEEHWRVMLTSLIVRILGIGRSIGHLAHVENEPDGLILMRSLYEHVVRFCWVAVEPTSRAKEWRADTLRERLKLHHDLKLLHIEGPAVEVLSPDELAEARRIKAAGRPKDLAQLALDADRYWTDRVQGLHPPKTNGKVHLLSLRGLYVGLYRVASRSAHGTLEAMDYCVTRTESGGLVVDTQEASSTFYSALSVPLIAIALVVSSEVLGWPGSEDARRVNDSFVADVPEDLFDVDAQANERTK